MKRRTFVLCLLAALFIPAILIVYHSDRLSTGEEKESNLPIAEYSSHQTGANVAPRSAPVPRETVERFQQLISAWETSRGLDGDRLEEQLRALITDDNAEELLRAAPTRFHGTYVANLLLSRWAERDRGNALRWLADQQNQTLFEVNSVTKKWVVQDPEGLKHYLDGLPSSPWKNLLLESTGRDALMNQDPEQAFTLLRAMNDGPAKTPLLANAVQQWAQWDPRAVVDEIKKLPNQAMRERLVLSAASGYAMVNPIAAADWLLQSFTEGPSLDRGLAGVMQAWTSTSDPIAGAQWVSQLPAGHTRNQALKELIAAWNRENAGGLENWMSTLPDSPIRVEADAALKSLVSHP